MAGFFPQQWLDELRSRADIVSVVSEYVPLTQKGRRYWGCCPFHQEKTPSFSVDSEKQMYYCFGCKAAGNVISFVMSAERLGFVDAVKDLAEKFNVPRPQNEEEEARYRKMRQEQERMFSIMTTAARFFRDRLYEPEGEAARGYLKRRGVSEAMVRRFGLGYAPDSWNALKDHLEKNGIPAQEAQKLGLLEQLLIEENLLRCSLFQHKPIAHDHHLIRPHGFLHEVRDEQNRHALLIQLMDNPQKIAAALWVQHGRGLIEDDHLGVHGQRAGNGNSLLLPAREHMRSALLVLLHAHHFQGLLHALQNFLPGHAKILRPEGDFLIHHRGDQLIVRVLEDHARRLPDGKLVFLFCRIHPGDFQPAGGWRIQRIDQPGKGGFAAAVVPEYDNELPFLHGKVDAVQGEVIGLILGDIGEFERFGL